MIYWIFSLRSIAPSLFFSRSLLRAAPASKLRLPTMADESIIDPKIEEIDDDAPGESAQKTGAQGA
jgi:hypothetical protein